jgi:UDP-GlcNAc:undecaprenyl-phosphate/decaprenyl-phosphate GlcNAc-1-phosphate transferase
MRDPLLPLALLFVCSGLTAYFATAIVRSAARRIGLLDTPGERKIHTTAIPRLGGVAIIFAFGFPLLLLAANERAADLVSKNLTYLFAVLASGSLIVGLGVYDDLVGTNAPKKFAVQFAAAIILVSFGFSFESISIGGTVIQLGIIGWIASVLWIVGVMNAINFIDGMDSLATVLSLTIAVSFVAIAIVRDDLFSLIVMTALAGSLAGFYPWNKPPAKIFMGDTGSLFIGLLLAASSIAKPSKSPTALLLGGPILALALPVLDTLFVMQARFGGAKAPLLTRLARIFTPDRLHIHHILIAKYGSAGKAIFRIWLITLIFSLSAVLTVSPETRLLGYAIGGAAAIGLLILRYRRRESQATPIAPKPNDEFLADDPSEARRIENEN